MPDDRVERLTSAGRRSVETSDVGPIAGLGEMLGNETEMPGLVEQAPAGDRFCRETAVRERSVTAARAAPSMRGAGAARARMGSGIWWTAGRAVVGRNAMMPLRPIIG